MMKNNSNILLLSILLIFEIANSQTNYIEIFDTKKHVEEATINKIKEKGFEIIYDNYVNNYFQVEKNSQRYLCDNQGNILQLPVKKSIIQNPTKKGVIFTADRSGNNPQSENTSKCRNIQAFNLKGEKVEIKIIDLQNYYFAYGQTFITRNIFTPYGDFTTIHKEKDGNIYEGLLQDNGILKFEANYDNIRQIGDKYICLKKGNLTQVYDLSKNVLLPIKFEDIPFNEFCENSYFNGNNIAKMNGKTGIYNFITSKWTVPNIFEDLQIIKNNITLDNNTPKVRNTDVIYNDKYVAKINEKQGIINGSGAILVPIQYFKATYILDEWYSFMIFNESNKYNYYDPVAKKEILPKFITDYRWAGVNKELSLLLEDKYWEIINTKSNETIFSESDKIINIENLENNFLFEYENKLQGLYSTDTKKFLLNNFKMFTRIDNTNSYYKVYTPEFKSYIIDKEGATIIPIGSCDGITNYKNGYFINRIAFKPEKVTCCYNLKGEEINKKLFKELGIQ